MALDPTRNFAIVTVSQGYTAADTSITLNAGDAAKLPDPATEGAYNLVWWDATNYPSPAEDPNVEIVRVTAVSADTLTVTRAQEGTTATDKNTAGATYKMILAPTKKTIDDIQAELNLRLQNIVEDTTPQLGGTLDAQGNNIDNVGILGVGITAPTQGKLVVQQDANPTSSSGIAVRSSDANTMRLWWDETNTIARIDGGGAGNSNISINGSGSGKLGIGTTSPKYTLDVRGEAIFKDPVAAKTANYTVLNTESNTTFTNSGATAAVTLTLPVPEPGLKYRFIIAAAQTLTIQADATASIRVGNAVSAAGGTASAANVGNVLELLAISTTEWVAVNIIGSWTLT